MRSEKTRFLAPLGRLFAALASLWLSGCDSGSATALELHPSELIFQVNPEGPLPPPRTVRATYVGSGLLVAFPEDSKRPSWLEITPIGIGASESTFRIGIRDLASVPPLPETVVARFTTSLADGSGNRFIDVPITLVEDRSSVLYDLDVSPSQVEFTAASGQASLPEARSVTVREKQGRFVTYSLTVSYAGEHPGWLELPPFGETGTPFLLRPNTALPVGEYVADVRITPTLGRDELETRLKVIYTVAGPTLAATPAALTFQVDSQTTEGQLSSVLALRSSGPAMDWRVVSTGADWLETSASSGNTQVQQSLELRVRESTLAGLDTGSYSATVTLAYSRADQPERQLAVPVKLDVAFPRVLTVMPYATEAGRSLGHVLRGNGFRFLRPGQRLRIGATETSAYQLVSDTEIRLDVPALPAGAHVLSFDNALGLERAGATLYAVQTPAFSEFSLARERRPQRLIYDPLRLAVYAVEYISGTSRSGLYRYRYVNGAWNEEELLFLPGITDAAMGVDGQSLYLAIGVGLYRLNLEDPSLTAQFVRNISQYSPLEVLNDGEVLAHAENCSTTATSPDGRRSIILDSACTQTAYVWTFDASSAQPRNTWVRVSTKSAARLAVERSARYVAIDNAVYTPEWKVAANLDNWLYGLSFSPDSRRLIGLFGDDQLGQVLYVYDVASPPVDGKFTRLAEIVVAGSDSWAGINTRDFITPDGRTLIKADLERFHVYPLPLSAR